MNRSNWKPALVVASLVLLLGALVWWGLSQSGTGGAPKRQTAKVSLLPDAPPPDEIVIIAAVAFECCCCTTVSHLAERARQLQARSCLSVRDAASHQPACDLVGT